jgi:hypothetical protein
VDVSITGTRHGWTVEQQVTVEKILSCLDLEELHQGDCIGVDEQMHNLVRIKYPQAKIIIHPPTDPKDRAFTVGDEVWPNKPYLERNHLIVDFCDLLIAVPYERQEQVRSGTWATIRYARQTEHWHVIVFPDGSTGE